MASADKKTVEGGCHCGYIKYTVDIPSGPLKAHRCNCTFCQKLGNTPIRVTDPSDFKLISPSSTDGMGDYAPNQKTAHKWFCKTCGVHVYAEGSYEFEGKVHQFFTVNLATVNQPQEGIDLSEAKLKYVDGLHNNWYGGEKYQPWSGGLP